MKRTVLFLTACAIAVFTYGQQGDGGMTRGEKASKNFKTIGGITLGEPDVEALRAEDAVTDNTGTAPWRFGYNNSVDLGLDNSGEWFELPNGDRLWLLKVTCTNALTVNLTFDQTSIPEGNELYVYNPDKSFILGKFTAYHLYEGELGTELVPGSTVIVEYYVPAANKDNIGNVHLYRVTHGYRTAGEFMTKAFGSSGSCNNNVNCPEGAPWANERNAVVMLVSGGSGFCTGALVNNTLNDGKPYVLTADHCYSNPASWTFRFNWQSASCTNPGTEPTFQSLSGAVLRARASASDFCLVEITGGLVGNTVPSSYSPYFLGWDNSGSTPTSAVGIHHPSGDIKKISFENDPLISTSFVGCPPNSHWGVTGWDSGVTEGGSSGSPLMDQNHRLIGQLHGGASACGASQLSDEYGKFSYSWEPVGSTSATQLKFWLDPNNIGAMLVNGYDPNNPTITALDAGIANPQGVSGTFCDTQLSPTVTITNFGTTTLTSATINYGVDGNFNLTYPWSGSLAQWQTATVNLPVMTVSGGTHTFDAQVVNPNGSTDEDLGNNTLSSTFTAVVNGQTVQLVLDLDCYGSETSWELRDDANNLLYSASGYPDNSPGIVTVDFCLPFDCFSFTINDSYGDGMSGCSAAQGGNGSYQILYNGTVMAEITEANADFVSTNTQNFCIQDNSLEENALASKVRVYPNPANDVLNIELKGITSGRIELLTIEGQLISVKTVDSPLSKLDVAALAAGVYFVKVVTEEGTAVKQIVIR